MMRKTKEEGSVVGSLIAMGGATGLGLSRSVRCRRSPSLPEEWRMKMEEKTQIRFSEDGTGLGLALARRSSSIFDRGIERERESEIQRSKIFTLYLTRHRHARGTPHTWRLRIDEASGCRGIRAVFGRVGFSISETDPHRKNRIGKKT